MFLTLVKKKNYPIHYNKIKIFINDKYFDMFDFTENKKKIKCSVGDEIKFKLYNFSSNPICVEEGLKAISVSSSINNSLYIFAYICFFLSMLLMFTRIYFNIFLNLALLIPLGAVAYVRIFKKRTYLNAIKEY